MNLWIEYYWLLFNTSSLTRIQMFLNSGFFCLSPSPPISLALCLSTFYSSLSRIILLLCLHHFYTLDIKSILLSNSQWGGKKKDAFLRCEFIHHVMHSVTCYVCVSFYLGLYCTWRETCAKPLPSERTPSNQDTSLSVWIYWLYI